MTTKEAATQERQLVVFDLSDEAYGVDIAAVREIMRMQEITEVPRAPEFVEGVINLRGNVVPIVELGQRLGHSAKERDKETRIVVMDIAGHDIGMIVDKVSEVLRIPGDSIEPPSSVITTADSDYLMGIAKLEKRLIILLDARRVLTDETTDAMADLETEAVEAAA